VRREPEGTALYRAVQAAWGSFVGGVEANERSVPRFCTREVDAFLRCGVLAHGFTRVHCDDCGHDDVVAFLCKGRGLCPSCGAARMVDTAAWLCDAVIPEVPVRQWVLSLPYRVRTLCAYDADACALVRGVLVRAVSGFYERTAKRSGVPRPRAGAVSFVQRFDSGLRLNVHFHVLWLDGVYGWEPGRGQPVFHAQREVNDGCVQQLVRRIADRVLRALRKAGKWVDADAAADSGDGVGDELLPGLAAAAVEGRAALGARAGQRDGRIGRDGRWEPQVKGPLCAAMDAFSLHAGAWVSARDREKLEKLCRYAARPAVAESRLVELSDGRIGYSLKKRWRDGTTAVVMTKEVLMERLCALVPKPRKHLVTYHGVLAPASGLRSRVVPRREEEGEAGGCQHGAGDGPAGQEATAVAVAKAVENVDAAAFQRQQAERRVRARLRVPHGGGRRGGGRRRYSWAKLLQRALGIEVLVCPKCSGIRRVLAAIHDPASIARVLGAMGLFPSGDPELAASRAPPGRDDGQAE
jgi:hypothetical protein